MWLVVWLWWLVGWLVESDRVTNVLPSRVASCQVPPNSAPKSFVGGVKEPLSCCLEDAENRRTKELTGCSLIASPSARPRARSSIQYEFIGLWVVVEDEMMSCGNFLRTALTTALLLQL
jgi:hypothetical protein